jgi:M6 family metalloprotease-like protein
MRRALNGSERRDPRRKAVLLTGGDMTRHRRPLLVVTVVLVVGAATAARATAMEKPTREQVVRYAQDGTLAARVAAARAFGNHEADPTLAAQLQNRLERLRLKAAGKSDAEIDSILPSFPSGMRPGLRSKGTNKIFALLLDFPDYPATVPSATIDAALFGDGVAGNSPRESLRNYYRRSSYSQLEIAGATLGYYRPAYTRASMGTSPTATQRENLIKEALTALDAAGHDFSQYDNDGDGSIDYFCVLWTGPSGPWASFWWGYYTGWSSSFVLDGKEFRGARYSWQWTNTAGGATFPPYVVIHETGHALGLPDLYDYDDTVGPRGGVGDLDMMDANWGDHNCFSKMLLDWITPIVQPTAGGAYSLGPSATTTDALILWPDYSPAAPFTEFFMVQNRTRLGNDSNYPADGLLIWHIDATLNTSNGFLYNNSYTARKLVRLMEADGLEHIEQNGSANAADYYVAGRRFSPTSVPNSNAYSGSITQVSVNGIVGTGSSFYASASSPVMWWRHAATGQIAGWVMDGSTLMGIAVLATIDDGSWQIAATADLNRDGSPDLVWRNRATGQDVVWFMDGTTFVSQGMLPAVPDPAWQIVAAADVNGDGYPDLLWRNDTTGQNVVWYMSGVTLVSQASLPTVTDANWQVAAFADVDGNRKPDVLWRNRVTGQNAVWYMDGVTLVSQGQLPTVADTAWYVGLVVDLDRDGWADLVWRNGETGQNAAWYLSGVTVLRESALPQVADWRWDLIRERPRPLVAAGDFNGDGQPDLVWRNVATGEDAVWYLNGATLVSTTALPATVDTNWQMVATADMNGDGQTDIVWRNGSTGQNVIWYMHGPTLLLSVVLPTVPDSNWQVVAVGDFNGDRRPDLVWRNGVTGQNVVWYLNGRTFLGQEFLPPVADSDWRVVAAADFDGNGRPDLVWRNVTTGQNVVWFLDGTTFVSQEALPTVPAGAWQLVMAGDFNTDGKPDLVWRNHVTGQNVIWNLDRTTFLGQVSLPSMAGADWKILRDRS